MKRGKATVKVTEEVVAHADEAAKTAEHVVYHSVEDGLTQYVGITVNFTKRAAQHKAKKRIKIQPLMTVGSREDARAVEQALIEIHGLSSKKKGGTLMNLINSIAKSNPVYETQLARGRDRLKSINYIQ